MNIPSIKNILAVVMLVIAFTSCNQDPTLQTYFVDNELQSGFSTYDVPASLLNIENIELTKEQKEAYESVSKLNILVYKLSESPNDEKFEAEINNIKTILSNPKYEELMRGGNNTDGKFSVSFVGDIENIDELVLFGSANDKGFVVARVLGDDMNAQKLMLLRTVLENADVDDSKLKEIKNFFSK